MFYQKCTKCEHSAYAHRQRDVRRWALDECGNSGCYCQMFSTNKKLIGKYTSQGIPINLTKEEHNSWFIAAINRVKIEKIALLRMGIILRGMYYR